jgi:hypothetical protein
MEIYMMESGTTIKRMDLECTLEVVVSLVTKGSGEKTSSMGLAGRSGRMAVNTWVNTGSLKKRARDGNKYLGEWHDN